MPHHQSPRRRARSTLISAVVAVAAFTGLTGCHALGSSSSSEGSPRVAHARSSQIPVRGEVPGELPARLPGDPHSALDVADGEVPNGVTVFDDQYPAVGNLEPDLLAALRRAATAAAGDGVQLYVDSGWRSRRYQEQLFHEAVAKHGSAQRAAEWVAPPGTSAHEAGKAVDLGPSDATTWLSEHGARYGLCQIYANEPWHYELRPDAVVRGCPAMYADPTEDPRMHQ